MKPKKVKSKLPAPRPLLRPVTGVLVLASPLGLLVCQGADAVDVSRLPPAANRPVMFDADIKPILALGYLLVGFNNAAPDYGLGALATYKF